MAGTLNYSINVLYSLPNRPYSRGPVNCTPLVSSRILCFSYPSFLFRTNTHTIASGGRDRTPGNTRLARITQAPLDAQSQTCEEVGGQCWQPGPLNDRPQLSHMWRANRDSVSSSICRFDYLLGDTSQLFENLFVHVPAKGG